MEKKRRLLLKATGIKLGTPVYIYDSKIIKEKCRELKKNLPGVNLYYACKANTNPEIIKLIYNEGFGIETVSPGEIKIAHKAEIPIKKITLTWGIIDEKELLFWFFEIGIPAL